ncbi:MAG: YkgJ family cysteine cluster protein [Steroidobacteraceae bacterium]
MSIGNEVDAGAFSDWLRAMRAVLRDEQDAAVPCGDCVGCCVSSYPIPLRPSDAVAQEQVPEQFLLHGPHPPGHMLMGFRDDGSCPFLFERACSIYRDRPQTCRDYDCRIFAATGQLPGPRPIIRERVAAWRFRYPAEEDRLDAAAVRRAADFIGRYKDQFPVHMRVGTPVAAAVVAVKSYGLFLARVAAPEGNVDVALLVAEVVAVAHTFDQASQNKKRG